MKLVIEIPEEIYKLCQEKELLSPHPYKVIIWDAVADGTPLPKGHGRLIDVNTIVYESECVWGSDGCCTTIQVPNIDRTLTIIEADKEQNE